MEWQKELLRREKETKGSISSVGDVEGTLSMSSKSTVLHVDMVEVLE